MTAPSEFMCPITMVVMEDPVLGSDGYTYEKSAISNWLDTNPKSPMTREPMRFENCRPNRALREAIERWKKTPKTKTKNRELSPSPPAPSAPTTSNAQPNYGTSIEADHIYAIMVQTQETIEQIKRSTAVQQPSVRQQPRTPMTPEQQRRFGGVMCILVLFIVIMIIVLRAWQANQ